MTLDLDNLARLVAASEKVHPTPWTVLADGAPPDDMRFAAYIDDDDENGVVQPGIRLDSAKLIVAVVNALPALLADHARLTAEVARLRGLVELITNLITNPASIEHGLVMTDEISEPFAEGDAEQRSSQTCARPKCSDPATVVTGLCVAHSVSAMGDSIDRTVERKRRKT
jgi:hypothetical protein